MKRFLLGFVFVAGLCLNVDAANPSFSSFATNHFITNNFLIRSRLNPLQFDTNASTVTITNAGGGGTTNYFNTIYVTNLYATNFYFSTNVFATNTYFTNIYVDNIYVTTNITVGGTNVATLGDLLWTNIGGVLQPVTHSGGTNQFTIAESSGWTGTGTNAFFDDGTFNGVATINATDGAIAKRKNAYELEDLSAGIGFLKNDGANNFTWEAASGGDTIWTNLTTYISPIAFQDRFKIYTNYGSILIGPNTETYWGTPSGGETLISASVTDNGDPNSNFAFLTTSQNATNATLASGSMEISTTTNRAQIIALVTSNSVPWSFAVDVNPGIGESKATLTVQNNIVTKLEPTAGASVTPYWLDTSITHTSGNLLEVRNNGANVFEFSNPTQIALLSAGANKSLFLESPTAGFDVRIKTGGAERWEVDPDGHLLTAAANSYNIGVDANGVTANSPKNVAARNYLVISQPHTPANSSETNYQGAIAWDSNYIYVWTATNVNKRATLNAW